MEHLFATIFRYLFKIPFFKNKFYGINQKIFSPYQLFYKVKKTIKTKDGIKYHVQLNDWIQRNLYFIDEYEAQEISVLKNKLKKGDVFVDVGANIGVFSLNMAKIVGNTGKVISFEPMEENYLNFEKNIELNEFKNILLEKLAVSSSYKTINLGYNINDYNLGMASEFSEAATTSKTIQAISLDQYFQEHKPTKIDAIKIDIEGGEYEALQGMKNVLQEFSPWVMIEINLPALFKSKHSEEEIYQIFKNLGYQEQYSFSSGDQNRNVFFSKISA